MNIPPTDRGRIEDAFPADCHFKVIARDGEGIAGEIERVLAEHEIVAPVSVGNRSSSGAYVTYNITVRIDTVERMRAIDGALGRIDGVRMVL